MSTYLDAVNAALYGPELKKVKLSDHEFNVKPIERIKCPTNNEMILKGQISHCLKGQPDDQVHYVIKIAPGTVVSIDSWIGETTLIKALFKITYIGGAILVSVFDPVLGAIMIASTNKVSNAEELIRKTIVGAWEPVCNALIALIGITESSILSVLNDPPPPAGYALARRFYFKNSKDWVTVGVESSDYDMILFGYQDRKLQFLVPKNPEPDTISVFRWDHISDQDWVTITDGSIPDSKLREWGYGNKTFSFFAYHTNAPDRVAVNRWWHEGDKDWVTIAEGEISDTTLKSWGYNSKIHLCYGKKL